MSEGDFSGSHVEGVYDTSPFVTDAPVTEIAAVAYIENRGMLFRYVDYAGN